MSRPIRLNDEVVTCFRDGTVTLRKNRRATGYTESVKEIGYQGIRKGDLVIHAMDAFAGAVGVSDSDGKSTPVYAALQPRAGVSAEYYALLVRHMALSGWITALATGIRERSTDFRFSQFGSQQLPTPPLEEQLAIVRYVRRIDHYVGTAVRAKQRLISLLGEQKHTLINHLVTRGTDPDIPLKDPNTLGAPRIPAHWENIHLKRVASHIVDCLHATPHYVDDGGFPVIRTADIEPGRTLHEDAHRVSKSEFKRWTSRLEPRAGDILYSREGGRFGIAAPVPPDVRLCIGQRMVVLRIKETYSSEYMMWQLNCRHVLDQAQADMVGSASPRVNVEQIRNYRLVAPPLAEQQEIVNLIQSRCKKYDATRRRAEREISLLREYQARLTADVVTGKLDVRAAAATLPDVDPHDPGLAAAFDANEARLDGDNPTEESM
ncbi:restriction endonuclease subunit S [Streptomyces monticola]|uniref:Restriction endonuclease subunit S n=1 Tax=Streptomyces monticola TaxID=2666263 RepID=A0ABW2JHP3_9ACTN